MKNLFTLGILLALMTIVPLQNVFAQTSTKLQVTLTTVAGQPGYITCPQEHSIVNPGESDGGGVPAMIDGNPGTYMHTAWKNVPAGPHYFQIDLGADNTLDSFAFYYQTRNGDAGYDFPAEFTIKGSNDNSNYEQITVVDVGDDMIGAGLEYDSERINSSKAYRYLRFEVTDADDVYNSTGNRTYFHIAEFKLYKYEDYVPQYSVTVSVNDAAMGSAAKAITGEETYSLTATANSGYSFVNWTIAGSEVSRSNPFSYTATEDVEIVANFVKEYCAIAGNMSTSDRNFNSFILTDGSHTVEVTGIQTAGGALYSDMTNYVLTTAPGATLSFSDIDWNGNWMQGYVFIDYNQDIEFNNTANNDGTTGGELVTYNCYNIASSGSKKDYGTNILGEETYGGDALIESNMPSWTLPSNLAIGDYRLRFNVAWNSIDPCGYSNMATDRGAMVDITLRIEQGVSARSITLEASPAEGGVVTANGTEGGLTDVSGIVTITASPNEGYVFVNWINKETSEVVSTNATFSNNEDGDVTYVANFEAIPTYSVTVTIPDAAQGSIEINGAAAQSSYTVYEGTAVEMTAIPAFGYNFSKWIINGSEYGENPFSVSSITVDATVEAVFSKQTAEEVYAATCKPTFNAVGNTTFVSAATMVLNEETTTIDLGDLAVMGQTGAVYADAYAGAVFDLNLTYTLNWGDLSLYQIVNGEATQIYGPFEGSWVLGGNTATVITNIVNTGLVVDGTTVTYPITISESANIGDIVIVRAITGATSACQTGISEGGYIDFVFNVVEAPVPTYAVSAEASPADGGQVTISANKVEENGTVELTATANEGYEFVNWTVEGVEVSTSESFTSESITTNTTFVANFVKETYTVTVTATAGGTATSDAVNPVEYGTQITLVANANSGYEFVGWMVDGSEGAKTFTWTVPVTEDLDFVAQFRLIQQGEKDVTVYDATEENDASYTTVSVANEKVWDIKANAISADKVSVSVSATGAAPQIKIEDGGKVTAALEVNRVVKKGEWAMMALPFAVDLANVTVDGVAAQNNVNIKVMVYDAAKRANESIELWTKSGWVDLQGTTIAANQGFAVAVNAQNGDEQTVTFASAPQTYDGADKEVALDRHASSVNEGADADWNFFGNPTLANAEKGANYALYIYNAEDDSYDEYASSDVVTCQPYAAMFAQSADDFNTLSFSNGTAGILNDANGVFGEMQFSLNGEDEARVVLSDEANAEYVRNEDALYFAAPNANLAQLYIVKGNIKMAVSEQPEISESIALGYKAAKAGVQTLTLTSMPDNTNIILKDNVTGDEVALTVGDSYTFESAAGTFNNRFVVTTTDLTGIAQATTGDVKVVVNGDDINVYGAEAGTEVVAYTTNGVAVASAVAEEGVTTISTSANGVIIVKVADVAVKVIK